ncbi:hypothetical protein [Mesorhizobium sp. INR15]|uniref:hypothetical protein n=1 Tax=Mesorhizobium sp. INR15 TaxID=2654248 RepID=UPI001896A347|nr:hypothetical protein [Mesorhizobium sp. INR15]
MTGKPAATYVVCAFEKPHWRTVLTATQKQEGDRYCQGSRRKGSGLGDNIEGEEGNRTQPTRSQDALNIASAL